MTSSTKKACKKHWSLPGFTIIEVLVALSIISVAVLTTVNLFSSAGRWMGADALTQRAANAAEFYLAKLFLVPDLRKGLFTDEEWTFLSGQKLPCMMPPKRVDVDFNVFMLVNRKVSRLSPLLLDIGIETVIDYHRTNKRNRSFWMETTLSELYLQKMN